MTKSYNSKQKKQNSNITNFRTSNIDYNKPLSEEDKEPTYFVSKNKNKT